MQSEIGGVLPSAIAYSGGWGTVLKKMQAIMAPGVTPYVVGWGSPFPRMDTD
ncbi:MAG TPA: hypothetical protein VLV31_06385 [Candidatus Acidoferrales bacterium]|nr:hypothetical protein [Candidatus Acidoferrales bacterium]